MEENLDRTGREAAGLLVVESSACQRPLGRKLRRPSLIGLTMGYQVIRGDEHVYEDRPYREGEPPRRSADVTTAAGLTQSRARLWRYPAHTRGRRHRELAQEEVFVVVQGMLTMLLGDPPDRVELPVESVIAVAPGTPLQLRNESDEEMVVFAYGAPPETGRAEILDDVEL